MSVFGIVAEASYRRTNLLFSILEMLTLVTFRRNSNVSRISLSKMVSSWSISELLKALEEISDCLADTSFLIGRRNIVDSFK